MQPRPYQAVESAESSAAESVLLDGFPRLAGGLRSAKTRALLDYWRKLPAGPSGIPHRRAVDPIGIGPRLLPHIFLCEYRPDGILIRLQGSFLSEQAGQTMTGLLVDESTFGGNAAAILRLYGWVRETGRPLATHENVLTTRHDIIPCEVMHLPILRDCVAGETEVGFVLGALDRLDRVTLPHHDLQAKEWDAIQIVDGV